MQAAQQDAAAFAPVYEAYVDRIFAYCLRRVENWHEAQDLTSAVFARALSRLPQYRGGTVAAWLFRIARSVVANHLRARRWPLSLDGDAAQAVPDTRPDPGDVVAQAEDLARVRALIAALPPAQQDVLLLKVAAGLNAREIGEILDRSPNAIRVDLHHILKRLRAQLAEGEPR